MSESDSFIEEVSDELRQDRLFAFFRRWAWLFILAVVAIVGLASWNEYRKAVQTEQAEGVGDALREALAENGDARLEAFSNQLNDQEAAPAARFALADSQMQQGQADAAAASLQALAADEAIAPYYRDLAQLRLLSIGVGEIEARRAKAEELAMPGRPFALLAREELGYMALADRQLDKAAEIFAEIYSHADATSATRDRMREYLTVLGADVPEFSVPGQTAPSDQNQMAQ